MSGRLVRRVTAALIAALAGTYAVTLPTSAADAATPFATALTRAPYLTDLVGLHVDVNFATDRSGAAATVQWGPAANGTCTLSSTVTAVRTSVAVGSVSEYQWYAPIELPGSGQYCYRAYLGSLDLLGGAASPVFTTQVPGGATGSFSFDVLGDWGQVDATGANPAMANLMSRIAASNARFLVTVGDNGYPNGSEINYGDLQQTGSGTSAIFGPSFWTVAGSTIPIFTAPGNHGLSGTTHTDLKTWRQDQAVTTSGGRYQNDVYCCVNGTASANYASEWYAFDAGNARFYVLDSAWGDTNTGSGSVYANDAAAHFSPGAPEYQWLVNDLATHPAQLKFAFFHYPLYSDNHDEPSDASLDGASSLEGVLARSGVQMVFNGHAHIYQRNTPSAPGMPITYVTGGGGSTPQPIGPCSATDAYGIGWSPTKLKGYQCGSGVAPTTAARIYHFLRVTVSGSTVTVSPTDSSGTVFDSQTYAFSGAPVTYLDSSPAALTSARSASIAFHASDPAATFTCSLDSGAATPCTSPVTYSGLTDGAHTVSVTASANGRSDPHPPVARWTVDTTAPSRPGGLTGTVASSVEVDLAWQPAQDATGVTGYRIYRDGSTQYQSVSGSSMSFPDTVAAGSTHSYVVSAVDGAGNESARSNPITVTTPTSTPIFSDGFETGSLRGWSSSGGLVVQTATVRTGQYAALGSSNTVGNYAKRTLPAAYSDAYARTAFDVVSQSGQINLLRLRTADGTSIGYAYVTSGGLLAFHNDASGTNSVSTTGITAGWHVVELHVAMSSAAGTADGTVQVWLDGTQIGALSNQSVNTGPTAISAMQIGDVQAGKAGGVAFDDAAFGASRLGAA
jgi:hypothetical protein